jgi:hypothetical protein
MIEIYWPDNEIREYSFLLNRRRSDWVMSKVSCHSLSNTFWNLGGNIYFLFNGYVCRTGTGDTVHWSWISKVDIFECDPTKKLTLDLVPTQFYQSREALLRPCCIENVDSKGNRFTCIHRFDFSESQNIRNVRRRQKTGYRFFE